MTESDAFDLPVTVASPQAADLYRQAIDALLAADPAAEALLDALLIEDPDCALARIARARFFQSHARGAEARQEAEQALALAPRLTDREAGHIEAMVSAVRGEGPVTLARISAHLDRYPRDLFVLTPVAGVFGLFGFSGERGREEALWAYLESRRPALEDHWWFRASMAFAECETGRLPDAVRNIERAWQDNSSSANTAHIRAHIDYERAADRETLRWLEPWFAGYGRAGLMHCHLGWHIALARLRLGEPESALEAFRQWVQPADPSVGQGAWGPPLNLVTDACSWLFRAQLRGLSVPAESWQRMFDVACRAFPTPAVRFADFHLALCFAMAGDDDGLSNWVEAIQGPTALIIREAAAGFQAFAHRRWDEASSAFAETLRGHEVLGGSRAQRDILVEAYSACRTGGYLLTAMTDRAPAESAQ